MISAAQGRRVRFCLVGVLLCSVCLAAVGCRKTPRLSRADRASLDALASYNPTYELDNQGRIIDLKLEGQHVDDRALEQVARLDALKHLSLYGASVSDKGLAKLRQNQLEALGLGGTRVTDQGLAHLEKMSSLRWLWVSRNDKITSKRLEGLQKALPGLTVYLQ